MSIRLPCLYCGRLHRFDENSHEANGVFNVFCSDRNCEDGYAFGFKPKQDGHDRQGNCLHEDVAIDGDGNVVDVCMAHCEPRGGCEECPRCPACNIGGDT